MKRIIIIVILVLAGGIYAFAQTNPLNDTTAIIKDIRKKFTYINENLETFDKKVKNTSDFATEGAEFVSYYENGKLRKLQSIYYGENGKAVIEYYFWDDRLFFVFDQMSVYNSPIYQTEAVPEYGVEAHNPNKTMTMENRYYFYELELVRWIDPDGNQVPKSDYRFAGEQENVLKNLQQALKEAVK